MNGHMRRIGLGLTSLLFALPMAAGEIPSTAGISFSEPVLSEANLHSSFGVREDPLRDRPSWHGGVDLRAEWDAPVFAPANGEVIYADTKAGYGRMVDLKVSEGWVIRFAHLSKINVTPGEAIVAGKIVGEVGTTGRYTGPHLHLETLFEGKQYNPELLKELSFYVTEIDRD